MPDQEYEFMVTVDGKPRLVKATAPSRELAQEAVKRAIAHRLGVPDEGTSPEEDMAPEAAPEEAAPAPKGWMERMGEADAAVADEFSSGQMARSAAAGVARIPAGAYQTGAWGLQAIPGMPDTLLPAANQQAESTLNAIRGGEYQPDTPYSFVEKGTEFGVGAVAPVGIASKGYGFWQVVKGAAKSGAFGAATSFEDDATFFEKTTSMAGGALLGALTAGALNAPGAIKGQYLKGRLLDNLSRGDPEQAQAAQDLMNEFPELADLLTYGQRSGSLGQIDDEAKAAGQQALRTYREQAALLKQKLTGLARSKWGDIRDMKDLAHKAANEGQEAVRKESGRLAEIRRAEWDASMNAAVAAITTRKKLTSLPGYSGSAQILIPIDGIERRLVDWAEAFGTDMSKFSPALKKLMAEAKTFKGSVSLETFVETMRASNGDNFTQLFGDVTQPANVEAGNQLRKLLFRAVDQQPGKKTAAGKKVSDAMNFVKAARESWRLRSRDITQFRRSAAAKILGLDQPLSDPVAALKSIANKSPAAQWRFREILQRWDPALLQQTRRLVFEDAMEKAISQRTRMGVAEDTFDPVAFTEAFMKGDTLKASGLYSEADVASLRELLPKIRAIYFNKGFQARMNEIENEVMTTPQYLKGVATGGKVTNIAFQARNLFRKYMNPFLDKAYFTPEGRKMLMDATQNRDLKVQSAAMGRIIAMMQLGDESSQQGVPIDPDAYLDPESE